MKFLKLRRRNVSVQDVPRCIKILVLGGEGVGKSCLVSLLTRGKEREGGWISHILCFSKKKNQPTKYTWKPLSQEDVAQISPTVGFSVKSFMYGFDKILFYDVGGGVGIRDIWSNYYSDIHGLIYVMSDHQHMKTDDVFLQTISHDLIRSKPIWIIVNNFKSQQESSSHFPVDEQNFTPDLNVRVDDIAENMLIIKEQQLNSDSSPHLETNDTHESDLRRRNPTDYNNRLLQSAYSNFLSLFLSCCQRRQSEPHSDQQESDTFDCDSSTIQDGMNWLYTQISYNWMSDDSPSSSINNSFCCSIANSPASSSQGSNASTIVHNTRLWNDNVGGARNANDIFENEQNINSVDTTPRRDSLNPSQPLPSISNMGFLETSATSAISSSSNSPSLLSSRTRNIEDINCIDVIDDEERQGEGDSSTSCSVATTIVMPPKARVDRSNAIDAAQDIPAETYSIQHPEEELTTYFERDEVMLEASRLEEQQQNPSSMETVVVLTNYIPASARLSSSGGKLRLDHRYTSDRIKSVEPKSYRDAQVIKVYS